jgi:hypothetical protein
MGAVRFRYITENKLKLKFFAYRFFCPAGAWQKNYSYNFFKFIAMIILPLAIIGTSSVRKQSHTNTTRK